ncbi:MAG: sugar phosphate isomerase/epimerase family protein [Gemmataceae bacterium]
MSQVCTLASAWSDDVAGLADAEVPAIEVWFTKLEQHLKTNSVAATLRELTDRNLQLLAGAYHGGLLTSTGAAQEAAVDHFRKRLELCQAFRIPVLLVAADATPLTAELFPQIAGRLAQLAQWATAFDVRLALEFRAESCCTNLETAAALVDAVRDPHLGLAFDLFHFVKGPSKTEDLSLLTAANLFHVQLCDVPGVPREFMSDADRVFPGEGDFPVTPLMNHLRQIGYAAGITVEVVNPIISTAKPSQVGELALTALRRTVGRSSGSTVGST